MNPWFYVIVVVLLLVLAGLSRVARRKTSNSASGLAEVAWDDLFVPVGPEIQERLLEAWRWKVGDDARVFRVTVFGDLFTQTSGGRIYWLDAGKGRYLSAAESAEQWEQAAKIHGEEWFHLKTLQDL